MDKSTSQHSASIWQADLVSVAALALLVVVIFVLDNALQPVFSKNSLLAAGIILAFIPTIVWLGFFYRRDRLEPEPKGLVLQLFLLGGLLAAGIGIPLVEKVFDVQSWLTRSTWTHLLGAILVIGFTQEFLKYAAVRYSVFQSSEFDECVDGIIYATAAGLGYATVLNINFVVNSGGVDLGIGFMHITITALAHASFGGVVGYFLGRSKFNDKPLWWMPAGVSLAAVLNGVFFFLRSTVTRRAISTSGASFQAWFGFILAAVLVIVVTALLSRAIDNPVLAAAAEEEA
jgi:RsiW-degrading membrane proteinase PrsW (M82 family)